MPSTAKVLELTSNVSAAAALVSEAAKTSTTAAKQVIIFFISYLRVSRAAARL